VAWSRRGLLTRLAWARCSCSICHTWRGLVAVFSYALHGLVVLVVSVTPDVVSSRSFHMPCMGLLVSRYPSCLAWSRHGLFTRLAWAHCSCGICHAGCVLVTVFSHALRVLVVLAVSITPSVVSSRSSHTLCVGSLFLRYLSRLAYTRRGLPSRLAWVRCSSWGWWSQHQFTGREK